MTAAAAPNPAGCWTEASLRAHQLADDEEVTATPHIARAGEAELDPEHVVHAEGPDHARNVKIIPTEPPPGTDAAHPDEPQPEHHPIHVPPTITEDQHMDHLLQSLENQNVKHTSSLPPHKLAN